jgi:DNA invertase Pin-like site-specific DNA recombinase
MNAIIYNRVSTKEQNPELQIKECEDFCKSKGWEIIDRLQEKESAFKDESKRDKFNEMIQRAEKREFEHIVVWNMDRFSRQPEEEVLSLVKKLNLLYGVDVYAVNGDLWSELVQSIGRLKEMGFMGEAISEFLEKVIRGLEFQRAYRESKTKSERVKLSVVKEIGKPTESYKGNKWGRKSLSQNVINEVLELRNKGKTIREITQEVFYWDKGNNKKQVSKSTVHKIISQNKG